MTTFGMPGNPLVAQGLALLNKGRVGQAIGVLDRAVDEDRESVDARLALANALIQNSSYEKAHEHIAHAQTLAPDDERVYTFLGLAKTQTGDTDGALASYKKAIGLNPSNLATIRSLADLYRLRAEYREAYDLLRPLMDSGDADMYCMLSFAMVAHRFDGIERSIEVASEVAGYEGVEPHFLWNAGFMLGRFLDQAGRYDEAFHAFARANSLRRQPYDIGRQIERFRTMELAWTESMALTTDDSGSQSELPVFVIGMPRSGTTLVERIIGAHPDAAPGGERHEITRAAQDIVSEHGNFLLDPSALGPVDLTETASAIEKSFASVDTNASRVVDKMPSNALRLPLIDKLFPKARVIRMRRDPRDTCLSCYFNAFAGVHPYAYDLRDLGLYITAYERLTDHYLGVLGIESLDVSYEAIVEDQEAESRRIIDFVGLEWHDDCLRFHEAGGTAVTASNEQVREKIYSSSVGRWKNYEAHLGPLFDALAEEPRAD